MADTRKFGHNRPEAQNDGDKRFPRHKTLTGEVPIRKADSARTALDLPSDNGQHDSRQTLQMQAPAVAAALGMARNQAPAPQASAVGSSTSAAAPGGPSASPNTPQTPAAHQADSMKATVALAQPQVEELQRNLTKSKPSDAGPQVITPPKVEVVKHQLPEGSPLDRRLVLLRDPDSERAAAFRVLRHHLLESKSPRVVAVTSANPKEGKTTTAVNLALALAECGRARVLLLDVHFRAPQLAGVFRFIPPWCLVEQLKAHRDVPQSPWGVVEVASTGLHVMAVNPRSEIRDNFDGTAFALAIERMRMTDYDHILIDCPSVIGSADVNLVQEAVDGVVITARARTTTARDLRIVEDQLTKEKVTGIALLE